ncbi:helix-turn-helix transcriptional regulator [Aneurinibacillus aneurinilyticus]|uniref:helix-turn-helix transcriptional regulator n=1 Tax=Aneurinibacillus aneurinilyticus TaxID=1391 RepID=UPI0023F2CD1C|nr:helix-turn-helix transcriptional regulator [Aneurinibacillus aneurinilyticus]
MRRWTKERVIEKIQDRQKEGMKLNSQGVQQEDSGLYRAARDLFGSWYDAVQEAGIDPDKFRRKRENVLPRGYWTTEKIDEHFEKLLMKTTDLSPRNVQKIDVKLYSIVVDKVGSWKNFLSSKGYEYNGIKKTTEWTEEKILNRIRFAKESYADLADATVSFFEKPLYSAAINLFGSWKQAVEAAGISYEKTKRNESWTKEKVIEHGKKVIEGKINLTYYLDINDKFRGAVKRYFPSIRDFYETVGISSEDVKSYGTNRIRDIRTAIGMNVEELAEKTGYSRTTIQDYERNQRQPDISGAIRIAKALGKTVEDIFS